MHLYILKRLFLMLPTLFGVAVLIFFLLRVLPGDIVELKYAGTGVYAPKEAMDRERAQLLDAIGGKEDLVDRAIDSHIKNLRRKISHVVRDQEVIHSIYGIGYRLEIGRLCSPT